MTGLILPRTAVTDRDVRRGREATAKVMDLIAEYREQGREPIEVRVSDSLANDMRAFFASFSQAFDGVLPPTVQGVRFVIGNTGGRDLQILLPNGQRDH